MIRRYIVCGLMSTVLLTVWINAAEYRSSFGMPNLLVIPARSDSELAKLATETIGQNFNITIAGWESLYPGFLRNVNYVLVSQVTAVSFQEANIIRALKESGLDKFPNKAFVLTGYQSERLEQRRFSDEFKQMFKGGIFILFFSPRAGVQYEPDNNYTRFTDFLRSFPGRFSAGLLSAPQEQKTKQVQISTALQKQIQDYYMILNDVDPSLTDEYTDIITQLQNIITQLQDQ